MSTEGRKVLITKSSRQISLDIDHANLRETAMSTISENTRDGAFARKLAGYKAQDKKRRPEQPIYSISCLELGRLLISSSCQCYYCGSQLTSGTNMKRDPLQWTLDRLDNSLNHSLDNCVVACLQCNLSRRCRDSSTYKRWRSVKIVKAD